MEKQLSFYLDTHENEKNKIQRNEKGKIISAHGFVVGDLILFDNAPDLAIKILSYYEFDGSAYLAWGYNNHTTIHRCTVDYFFQGGNGKYKLANKSEKTI
jgi:hypothetical protein